MSDHPSNANPSAPHRAAAVILVPERHRNHNPPSSPAGCLPHPGNANAGAASPNSALLPREYRKGNWTLHETLVLIAAKRLDDERRSRGGATESKPTVHQNHSQQNCRSAEQRWKWVENYCWNHQCFRSQNQCNDKWDNLLRDYKKVRDYEARRCPSSSSDKPDDKKGSGDDVASSYWTMEKHERKERNLPSNLVQEVFEALTDVLSRRNANKTSVSNAIILTPRPPPLAVTPAAAHESLQPIATPAAPPPPPPLQQQEPHRQPSISELSSSTEGTDASEREDSDAKRHKVRNLGASVVRGASVLARALLACEDRRSKRHRDLLDLEERRLRAEEDRTEMNREGLAGLIAAVNNLAGAVHALVSDHRNEISR